MSAFGPESFRISVTAHGCEKVFAEKVSTEYHKLARGSEKEGSRSGLMPAARGWRRANGEMSALKPIADISTATERVRFVP
jgi:hypothetical protein